MSVDERRPFVFTCPWCGEGMTAYMDKFGVARTIPWRVHAEFETEHDCVTRRA